MKRRVVPEGRSAGGGVRDDEIREGASARMQSLFDVPWLRLDDGTRLVDSPTHDGYALWWWSDYYFRRCVDNLCGTAGVEAAMDTRPETLPDADDQARFEQVVAARERRPAPSGGWRARVRASMAMPVVERVAARRAARLARGVLGAVPMRDEGSPCVLFIGKNDHWRDLVDVRTGTHRTGDVYFDALMQELTGRGPVTLRSMYPACGSSWPLGDPTRGIRRTRQRNEAYSKCLHVPMEFYWDPATARATDKARRELVRRWRSMSRDAVFRDLVSALEDDGRWLEAELRYYHASLWPRLVGFYEMARRALDDLRPDAVVLINEYGRLERPLIAAASSLDVRVVAMQHGEITRAHRGYMVARRGFGGWGSVAAPDVPTPHRTLVFGDRYRRLLVDAAGFSKGSVATTGPTRADLIHHAPHLYDRSKTCAEYGIDPDRRIVVWMTQTHGLSLAENEQTISAMYTAMSERPDLVLVVKPHPGEDQEMPLYDRGDDHRPKILPASADLYAVLNMADLVVIKFSTVGLEAVAMGCPLVVLNLGGEPDIGDYVESGVAAGVYDAPALGPTIDALLDDDAKQAKHRSHFVKHYLGSMDGHASERIGDVVMDEATKVRKEKGARNDGKTRKP